MMKSWFLLFVIVATLAMTTMVVSAFSFPLIIPKGRIHNNNIRSSSLSSMVTIEAPTRETTKTDRRTNRRTNDDNSSSSNNNEENNRDIRKEGPLEYLEDPNESREMDDPFHILLLGETFDKPKITLNYVSGNLQYTLDMPYEDAMDASMVAQDFGMACLGTWSREECLTLGRQLRIRDLVVRVVPYAAGGNRSWQSKEGGERAGFGRSGEGLKDATGGTFLQ